MAFFVPGRAEGPGYNTNHAVYGEKTTIGGEVFPNDRSLS